MIATLFALTMVQAPAAAERPTRWSILAEPCSSDGSTYHDEIVVCGQVEPTPRPPRSAERGPPDRPLPSNPNVSGAGALAAAADPCATRMGGCQVGVDMIGGGVAVIRAVGKLIDPDSCCEEPGEYKDPGALVADIGRGLKKTFGRKVDKSNRIPIPLDPPGAR